MQITRLGLEYVFLKLFNHNLLLCKYNLVNYEVSVGIGWAIFFSTKVKCLLFGKGRKYTNGFFLIEQVGFRFSFLISISK